MDTMGRHGMLFLAAAVSDFYVPRDKLREHKIDSSRDAKGEAGLSLHLEGVSMVLQSRVSPSSDADDVFLILEGLPLALP